MVGRLGPGHGQFGIRAPKLVEGRWTCVFRAARRTDTLPEREV